MIRSTKLKPVELTYDESLSEKLKAVEDSKNEDLQNLKSKRKE